MRPIARSEGLITQVVGTETLVYDRADMAARCLSAVATAVWKRCDGEHTVEMIAAAITTEVTLPAEVSAEAAVLKSLAELDEHGLLLVGPDTPSFEASLTNERRELIKALAMVPLFPQISKIMAPTMNQTSSTPPTTASATGSLPGASASVTATASRTGSSMASVSATTTRTPTATVTSTGTSTPTPTPTLTPTRTATSLPPLSMSSPPLSVSQTPQPSLSSSPLPPPPSFSF